VKLDPVLLEILVCPDCKGSLTVDQDHDELICNGCGLIYPVRDNIPIMLVDEARRPQTVGSADEADDLSPAPSTARPAKKSAAPSEPVASSDDAG
jgi:uncharacterized protein